MWVGSEPPCSSRNSKAQKWTILAPFIKTRTKFQKSAVKIVKWLRLSSGRMFWGQWDTAESEFDIQFGWNGQFLTFFGRKTAWTLLRNHANSAKNRALQSSDRFSSKNVKTCPFQPNWMSNSDSAGSHCVQHILPELKRSHFTVFTADFWKLSDVRCQIWAFSGLWIATTGVGHV